MKTGVSFGTATLTALILVLFGIDLWFTWAMICVFLMNYVPYIGSWISLVPPIALGLIIHDPATIALMLGILAANQLMWGNFIEPKWAGRALDLSPPRFVSSVRILLLGLGYCWHGSSSSICCYVQDCTRQHRSYSTNCYLAFRESNVERAWEIAVKMATSLSLK